MQPAIIIEKYWDIFLSHICEFYPIDKGLISKYANELDWSSLSKSKVIQWDMDFLQTYEERLTWHELAWNDSILWTADKIDTFKKRLDWYYLSRNINLPITEAFIEKYAKKLFVIESNPMLTKALIKKFNLRLLPADDHETQKLKKISSSGVEEILQNWDFYHNQQLFYSKVLLPIINTTGLAEIFNNKFNYTQRYYYLDALQQDIHGLTPEYRVEGEDPFGEYVDGRGILDIGFTVKLKYGPLQEGPDRLYEVPRFSGMSYYTILLVSENVRSVLEKFKLPKHIFHPVTLIPKKIITGTKFYILQLDYDTLAKDLDYNQVHFNYKSGAWKAKKNYGTIESKIRCYDDLKNLRELYIRSDDSILRNAEIMPDSFLLKSDLDIYSFSYHGKIIVNEMVKDELEKHFPKQMSFESAQLLKIKIGQEVYDRKKNLQTMGVESPGKVAYKESAVDKYFYEKLERLEKADPPLPAALLGNDEFRNKEHELNVIFPASFKECIRNNSLDLEIEGYDLLPVTEFYIQNEYADTVPESYKSVVIAENGIGDSINLLLEKDSDYKLGTKLYLFLHETGEVEEI